MASELRCHLSRTGSTMLTIDEYKKAMQVLLVMHWDNIWGRDKAEELRTNADNIRTPSP